MPAQKWTGGVSLRSHTGPSVFPDVTSLNLNQESAERILARGVSSPPALLQLGVNINCWFHNKFSVGFEMFYEIPRDLDMTDGSRDLKLEWMQNDGSENFGFRVQAQMQFDLTSFAIRPTLMSGATLGSDGYNFVISQPKPGTLAQNPYVDKVVVERTSPGLFSIDVLNLAFFGVGVEIPLFATLGEGRNHELCLELLAQRFYQNADYYSIEDYYSAEQYELTFTRSKDNWWVFSFGLTFRLY